MKRTIAPTALVIVFATVFVLGILAAKAQAGEHRGCSNASLQGSFGFTSTGTLLALPPPLAGPFAEIGRQTFDGRGNTDATATLSANGNIVSGVTVQGTYQVNPDCTGSMTLFVSAIWCYVTPGLCDRRRRGRASSHHHRAQESLRAVFTRSSSHEVARTSRGSVE